MDPYRALFDALPDGLVFLGPVAAEGKLADAPIVRVNQAAADLSVVATPAEAVGRTVGNLFPWLHGMDLPTLLARDESRVVARDDGALAVSLLRLDRDRLALRLARSDGVASERDLDLARRELERCRDEVERFAALASHDLQEPLRIVGMYSQLLERRVGDQLDETARHHLDRVLTAVDRMHRMIDDLVALSRVEAAEPDPAPVDLHRIVKEAVAALGPAARDAHVTWTALPSVPGNADQLRDLFVRLLDNAVRYRGEAPPEVRISARREGDEHWITVADNGEGIDPAKVELVFLPFQRLHSWETHPGSGMGLALARRIVEHHGGWIDLESEPGRGTAVHVRLPA